MGNGRKMKELGVVGAWCHRKKVNPRAGAGSRVNKKRVLLLCLLLPVLVANLSFAAPNRFLTSFLQATGMVLKFYPAVGTTPSAIVRADRIHLDHQKRGFFRIGVLPMLALERCTLEVCDTNQFLAALADAGARLCSDDNASGAVEGRDFCLSFTDQTNGVLHSRTVRLEKRAEWLLEEGAISQPGAASIPFRRATLIIAGPQAGQLTYETAIGPAHVHLLSLACRAEHEPKKP